MAYPHIELNPQTAFATPSVTPKYRNGMLNVGAPRDRVDVAHAVPLAVLARLNSPLSTDILNRVAINRSAQDDNEACSFVIDCGEVYDPEAGRFDPEVPGGLPFRRPGGARYSAAGLVWAHWGIAFVSLILPERNEFVVSTIAHLIDDQFIRFVDKDATEDGLEFANAYGFGALVKAMEPTKAEIKAQIDKVSIHNKPNMEGIMLQQHCEAAIRLAHNHLVRLVMTYAEQFNYNW